MVNSILELVLAHFCVFNFVLKSNDEVIIFLILKQTFGTKTKLIPSLQRKLFSWELVFIFYIPKRAKAARSSML